MHEYPYETEHNAEYPDYMTNEDHAGHMDGLDAMDEERREADALAQECEEMHELADAMVRRFIEESAA